MHTGQVDLAIVGADRIASNGDFANKIGTYEKAVVAKENNIPFYVAAPGSTFDFTLKSGNEIPIEERSQDEVKTVGMESVGPLKPWPGFIHKNKDVFSFFFGKAHWC